MTAISGLLAVSRRDRLRAIRDVATPPDEATAYVLRRLLFTDGDAHIRSAAARTLGTLPHGHDAEAWLLEALRDRTPLVRDTILRALARCGTSASRAPLRTLIETDGIWWVRRSAVYALGAVAGEAELPAFTRALGDPFWRVRHAAVRVLALLGAHDPEVRLEMQDAPPSSTLAFLRGTWGPVAVEAPQRAGAASLLPPALLDPDPAVVTARVPDDPDVTPLALVELLCDPHATLRAAASKRLARSGDLDALEAALDWLEEPRIPQVRDTVVELLDGLGDPARELARRALARTDRPAATKWAIDWVIASRAETLYASVLERVRDEAGHLVPFEPPTAGALAVAPAPEPDPALLGSLAQLRCAAVTLGDDADLVAWAQDPAVTDAAAVELHGRRAFDALASLDGGEHPRTRALQVDAAARRREPNLALVRSSITDSHPGPRAIAARWLARKRLVPLAELLLDADPTVREAALSAVRVDHAPVRADLEFADVPPISSAGTRDLELADGFQSGSDLDAMVGALFDADPWVRRAAIRALVTLSPTVGAPPRALVAFRDADPGVRRIACELPATSDVTLARILACSLDADEAVRAAASDALGRLANSDQRVAQVLDGDIDATTRAAAYAWLVRAIDDAARDLAVAALGREMDPHVRRVLEGVVGATTSVTATTSSDRVVGAATSATISSDQVAATSIAPTTSDTATISTTGSATERRMFGRAGFEVAPLAISGAFDLPVAGLERAVAAGVDLFFWEPGYDLLARFLRRRPQLRVITGTYHADAKSIRADVERALTSLGRTSLDVFLLFWTRSPARLDAAAYACLDALKRAGKIRAIGFSTHHRELARDAIQQRAWDVVMIRHSAAHPGIETDLLPIARERGTAIVTFSALTYGRMTSGAGAPTPAECYQYSLAQPGVTACISAPRKLEELEHNLEALATPSLPADRLSELRTFGIGVRAESQRFNTLLRQPTRDAAAAAREMLASEPAPDVELRAPAPTAPRRSRTRLGGRRRR